MLIPSIDLQGGRIVQLVQGERLALETDDVEGWIERFSSFLAVQLIDLDAAKNAGDNSALAASICARLPCRVGGGIRTADRAAAVLGAGARKAIVGSALFRAGEPDLAFATTLADRCGADRLIAAVDARGGRVVIDGWRTQLAISPVEAIHVLEPFFDAIALVRSATTRAITAAGGVTTQEEVDWLASIGVDAVAGMAIYTGRLKI
jgi:phosphoribosylformimino-5-aminoimidazole carboxamide ribotide isomerase